MSFASIWSFTSKMALVIIKKKNRISRPADNFQVKKGCIREACVLIPSVPEFCHTFFQHLQLQLICQDHFLNLIQKSQYFSFNFIAIRFINKNKEPLKFASLLTCGFRALLVVAPYWYLGSKLYTGGTHLNPIKA